MMSPKSPEAIIHAPKVAIAVALRVGGRKLRAGLTADAELFICFRSSKIHQYILVIIAMT